ncbi:MAG: S-methyl-5-thioribose-1-phosphate isomerase [Proteobacteria bacterium]|nr:S-methyl-5-thioribose-1-phosphate isomerase [Pseudomonadota bacterium]
MKLESLAIKYHDGELSILDQQALPLEEVWINCHTIQDMCDCIISLKVRGAPLIGIAAVLSLAQYAFQGASIQELRKAIQILVTTRPTAVNLKNYMDAIDKQLAQGNLVVAEMAKAIFLEDIELCEKMATHGANMLPFEATVLTYCNTGSLATAGMGTALGVIKKAHQAGKIKHVYACETRPLLQGARLTAWELEQAKIPYTLICDNMAGSLMRSQKIDCALVGADRIAMNGDTANKIGTYQVAILCKHHQIPFYVVAPYTTFDPACDGAKSIVIEQRAPEEVKGFMGKINFAPQKASVYNPSFDVTPGSLISGFIFDKGIYKADELLAMLN